MPIVVALMPMITVTILVQLQVQLLQVKTMKRSVEVALVDMDHHQATAVVEGVPVPEVVRGLVEVVLAPVQDPGQGRRSNTSGQADQAGTLLGVIGLVPDPGHHLRLRPLHQLLLQGHPETVLPPPPMTVPPVVVNTALIKKVLFFAVCVRVAGIHG